jgi:hypothetical protein
LSFVAAIIALLMLVGGTWVPDVVEASDECVALNWMKDPLRGTGIRNCKKGRMRCRDEQRRHVKGLAHGFWIRICSRSVVEVGRE